MLIVFTVEFGSNGAGYGAAGTCTICCQSNDQILSIQLKGKVQWSLPLEGGHIRPIWSE